MAESTTLTAKNVSIAHLSILTSTATFVIAAHRGNSGIKRSKCVTLAIPGQFTTMSSEDVHATLQLLIKLLLIFALPAILQSFSIKIRNNVRIV